MTSAAKKKLDYRFKREMTAAAEGMRSVGVMDEEAYKLTMRNLTPAQRLPLDRGHTGDRTIRHTRAGKDLPD
jgi:hypothetical protein